MVKRSNAAAKRAARVEGVAPMNMLEMAKVERDFTPDQDERGEVREEFKENEELPNTTNPDDWAKIAGKKGERILYIKSLVGQIPAPQRNVEEVVPTGQYL
jgi:proteasome-associated ATPase